MRLTLISCQPIAALTIWSRPRWSRRGFGTGLYDGRLEFEDLNRSAPTLSYVPTRQCLLELGIYRSGIRSRQV
jgi:hypothetical protein